MNPTDKYAIASPLPNYQINSERYEAPKGNILLVDDTPENLRLLSELLSQQGYKVRQALNGQTALKAAQVKVPDLILLDINMPQMNGYEVCEKLKTLEETREIPIIFVSALNEALDKVKAFNVGGADYITKPFQIEEVLARVKNQLKLRYSQNQLVEQNVLLEKKNIMLEQEVHDRIKAEEELRQSERQLKIQTERLEQALRDLKQAQTQMVQNEKMVSLGQLIAGIAHEINNPITFIYGNLTYASQYVRDLVNLIEIYQEEYPHPTPKVQEKTEEIDLDFLTSDVQKLISSMQMGAERIRQIVVSLRNFSRLDEADMKPVNIHEGIDSTLLILQHRLRKTEHRPNIEVIEEYGQLPQVSCYASQLNQVFMHLLNNAIDALESQWSMGGDLTQFTEEIPSSQTQASELWPAGSQKTTDPFRESASNVDSSSKESDPGQLPSQKPTIWICTELTACHTVKIHIRDNGPGIAESARSRLFDPFFTTKPVGTGTGLGLSISYQIVVEKHKGRLMCCASPGHGAEFVIEIPVHQTN